MKPGFTKISPHQHTASELVGKNVRFALYDDSLNSPAMILVDEQFAALVDYRSIESILNNVRTAIINAMVRHNNPTLPRRQ